MGRTFRYTVAGDPAGYIDRAKRVAADNGAQFVGDESSGTFSGRGVEGRYAVDGEDVVITIDKKPMIAPWGAVEAAMGRFFT